MTSDRDLFLAYGALMSGAILPIYHGAFASLRTPASTLKALKKGKDEEDMEEEDTIIPETLKAEDAYWLPVVGSAVLFSMFLVFKYLDKLWVDRVLGLYFGAVGTFAVSKVLLLFLRGAGAFSCVQPAFYRLTKTTKTDGKRNVEELLSLRLTLLHPPVVVAAIAIVATYLITGHWVASNIIALSLSVSSISMLSLDSFQTGGIMLMGLFLYDIFWVFGTNVMVSVARGFEGPIKIVWPKNFVAALTDHQSQWQMTMLGLGDIVIPGVFVALALRFDQHIFITSNPKKLITKRDTSFPKPYFQATLFGYFTGLATTMAVMHFTGAAQPALLYLSPACIAAVALCAAKRNELQRVWAWTDEDPETDKKDDGKNDDDTTAQQGEEDGKRTTSSRRRRKLSSTQ